MSKKVRYIALYLPQFHPVKENDENWGKGFTEWTNVAKAKPLFKGHYQPHVPADLGFYDLRLEATRVEQAELAKQYGIEGFCYWYYWFGNGEKILEMPIQEVIKSGNPDFPFCLAWANHSWTTSTWTNTKTKKRIVIKDQKYLGASDYEKFFYEVLPALKDRRYITVDGKPMFMFHNPVVIPDLEVFIKTWRKLAEENGLKGVYFIGTSFGVEYSTTKDGKKVYHLPKANLREQYQSLLNKGLDAINSENFEFSLLKKDGSLLHLLKMAMELRSPFKFSHKCTQEKLNKNLLTELDKEDNVFPSIFCNWDRSPRVGKGATIITESTPDVFKKILKRVISYVSSKPEEHRIVFLRSWNEWGEGNHIEPDLKYGRGYLEAIKHSIEEDEEYSNN